MLICPRADLFSWRKRLRCATGLRHFTTVVPGGSSMFPALVLLSLFFDDSHRKDWILRRNRCIRIYRRSEIPLAKFEECLQRLEQIVQELEKGEVPLEKSLTLFEEGMQLSSSCRKELEEAEGKVEILLKKNGKLQAEPFEPLTEKASGRR
jgi:exodeoxyribonuclease VII small subunit